MEPRRILENIKDEFSQSELSGVLDDETSFKIFNIVTSHPSRMTTVKELNYLIPSNSKKNIRSKIEKLEENRILKEVQYSENKKHGYPVEFVGATEEALENFPTLSDHSTKLYERVNRTEDIWEHTLAPRPNWNSWE